MKYGFFGELAIRYKNGTWWYVVNPDKSFGYVTQAGECLVPYDGMTTDFASVPTLFTNMYPRAGRPGDQYGPAAVIHDYLYDVGKIEGKWITQKRADAIFVEACKDPKYMVQESTIRLFEYQLAHFGFFIWNRHHDGRPKSNDYGTAELDPLPSDSQYYESYHHAVTTAMEEKYGSA